MEAGESVYLVQLGKRALAQALRWEAGLRMDQGLKGTALLAVSTVEAVRGLYQ
jgi:hypothetical protein